MHTNIRFAITGDLNRFNTTNLCQELGLQNIVTQSTPQRSILDVILTDAEFYTADVVSLIPLIGRSQHNCVLCQPAPQAPPSYTVRRYRPWRDSSLLAFGQWITLEPWDDILQTQDVNEAVMMLEQMLRHQYETAFVDKTVRSRVKNKPWVTPYIIYLMELRRRACCRGRLDEWRALYHRVQQELRPSKSNTALNV